MGHYWEAYGIDDNAGGIIVRAVFMAAVGDHLIAAMACIQIALPKKLDTQ
jgi:hypothetical protein